MKRDILSYFFADFAGKKIGKIGLQKQ